MTGIVVACHGMSRAAKRGLTVDDHDSSLDVDAQATITRTALELKRDAQAHIRRVICSEATCAYQTALIMGLVLDIPMGAIRRDGRLGECRITDGRTASSIVRKAAPLSCPYDFTPQGGEDNLMVLARHLAAIMDHGHGLLDSSKAGLLVIGHPLGLKALSHHFRQPSDLPPGSYRLLRL